MNEYLTSKGEETHTIAVIQTNPEQSKHLETARMKIHGTCRRAPRHPYLPFISPPRSSPASTPFHLPP